MKVWQCTGPNNCLYTMSDIEYVSARADFICPKCGKTRLSEWKSVEWPGIYEKEGGAPLPRVADWGKIIRTHSVEARKEMPKKPVPQPGEYVNPAHDPKEER